MLTLTTRAQLRRATLDARQDVHLRALLRLRHDQLGGTGADFHVVEPGDTLASAEQAIGWPMTVDGEPCWDWARAHSGGWHEVTFILSDKGSPPRWAAPSPRPGSTAPARCRSAGPSS